MKLGNKQIVQFSNVSFAYDNLEQKQILQQIDFTVREKEFISIVGPSGSGKSTIFRLIAGLEQPTEGTISLYGEQVNDRLGKVGYMPQQDLLMPWRTVLENAALPLELQTGNTLSQQDVFTLLTEFGLAGYENAYPHELSGGMRQRVSFLRATLTGAKLLLLDEPFSALDAMTKLFMQEWLLTQWEKHETTIIFITHDISEALFLSDRIFTISDTPITALQEMSVPLVRPRKQTDLDVDAVIALKHQLIEQFRKQEMT